MLEKFLRERHKNVERSIDRAVFHKLSEKKGVGKQY